MAHVGRFSHASKMNHFDKTLRGSGKAAFRMYRRSLPSAFPQRTITPDLLTFNEVCATIPVIFTTNKNYEFCHMVHGKLRRYLKRCELGGGGGHCT